MDGLGQSVFDIIKNTTNWDVSSEIAQIIITAVSIVVWILIGLLVNRISKTMIYKLLRVEKKGPRSLTVANLMRSVARYIVWFIVGMIVLSNLGVNLTPFIASAGVVGLAIGFGAQEIVKDFISGFFIIFDGEFDVGEIIEVDGFKGTVLSLGLRTTIIENWKGERKTINNGNIGSVVNYSKANSIAIIDFGVAYDTNLLKLAEIMPEFLEEARQNYEVITDTPQFLGVVELADSSINMRIIAKTQSMKHFQVERDVRRDLKLYLDKNNIEIPFPQVVVHNAKD